MVRLRKLQVGHMNEITSFEQIVVSDTTPLLFLCDHASNHVPFEVNSGCLGLPSHEMERHIAYDIGARGVTLELVRQLGGVALLSRFSRLVIDPNRAEDDPTLLMRLYDGTIIPANRHADEDEIERRLTLYHRPYHHAVRQVLDSMQRTPIIVSIHSFTAQLKGRSMRPWHIGVLSADDRRIADPLLAKLNDIPDICVGDNEPYVGKLEGDCMTQHGIKRGLPHVLIEIRNDLIADVEGEKHWARRLAPVLNDVFDDFRKTEKTDG